MADVESGSGAPDASQADAVDCDDDNKFVLIRDLKQIATCFKEEHSLPDGKTCTIFRIKTTQPVRVENKDSSSKEDPVLISKKVKVLNLSSLPAFRRIKQLSKPKTISGARAFKCRFCTFSCTRSFDLRRHQAIHSGEQAFKCKQCSASFFHQSSLTLHMKRCHILHKPYSCKECDEAFATPKEYLSHAEEVHPDRTVLNKSNLQFKSFGIETDESCKVFIDGKTRYKCSECQKHFTNSTVLKYHIMSLHKKMKPFQCDVCKSSFSRKFDLKKHEKIHTTSKAFKCDMCPSSFPALGTLTLHMRGFHRLVSFGAGRFECNFCKKTLSNRANLKEHILSVHRKERSYKCSVCNSAFYRNSLLQRHMLTHSGDKPHRCYMCDAKFGYRYPLARHMRKRHGIAKPYKCDACGLAFLNCRKCMLHKRKCCPKKVSRSAKKPEPKPANKEGIEKVSVVISGDYPRQYRRTEDLGEEMAPVVIDGTTRFGCKICEKTFSNKANVKDHIFSVHKKERTFHCNVCNASFYRNCLLNRHMKSHTGDKPHKCERCNVGFTHKMNLTKHRKTCGQLDKAVVSGTVGGPVGGTVGVPIGGPAASELLYQRKYGGLENPSQPVSALADGLSQVNETGLAPMNLEGCPPQVNSDSQYVLPGPIEVNHGQMSFNASHQLHTGPRELNPQQLHASNGPALMNATLTHLGPGVTHMNAGPTHINPGPTHINPGHTNLNPGPTHINPGPTHINPGHTNLNPGPTHINPGPTHINPGPTLMDPGPALMNPGTSQSNLGPTPAYAVQSQVNPDDIAHLMIEIGNSLFPQSADPSEQLMTVDTSQMYYKCHVCSKYFTSNNELNFHVQSVHTSVCQYNCTLCDSTFATNNELFEHQKSHESERPFSCHLCHARFTLKSSLTVHIRRRHTLERPFKCEICERPFVTSSEMHAHKKSHFSVKKPTRTKGDQGPRSSGAVERRYECSECLKTYTTRSVLKVHVLSVHQQVKPFTCIICDAAFSRKSFLKRHNLSHSGEKPFQCDLCSTRFTQRGHLNAHMRRFHPLGLEKHSPRVSKKPRPGSMRKRVTIHRPYECGMCGKQFSNSKVLLLHKEKCYSENVGQEENAASGRGEDGGRGSGGRGDGDQILIQEDEILVQEDNGTGQDSGEDGYPCSLCGESFPTVEAHVEHYAQCYPANVEAHGIYRPKVPEHVLEGINLGVRYSCSQCNKSYSTKTVLRTHIMSAHENVRPFHCDLCDAAFARKSYLDRHLISHSGAKPHRCELCSARYTQKYNLTLHLRKQHDLDV